MKKIILTLLLVVSTVLLCACSTTSNKWDINIQDNEGHGIPGVTVQICTDSTCKLLTTDNNGTIDYDGDESSCEVYIYSVPEGYEECDHVFTVKKGVKEIINLVKSDDATETEAADTAKETDASTRGEKIVFSSVDMNGNTVDDSIFAENKVTMINLWEPWCSPCKGEMPDLEKLYQEYKDQDFTILGIHMYNDDLEEVVKNTGVTYPVVESTDVFENILNTTGAVPTTFFVDSEGNILMPDTDSEEFQTAVEENVAYFEEDVEAYKNGDYDDVKNDPDWADYLELLEKMSKDENLIAEVATSEAMSSYGSGFYVGAMDYDSWKELIESQLASVK